MKSHQNDRKLNITRSDLDSYAGVTIIMTPIPDPFGAGLCLRSFHHFRWLLFLVTIINGVVF
jgi:hypothetical protein